MKLLQGIGGSLINPAFIEEIVGGRDKEGRHIIHCYFTSGRGRTIAVYESAEALSVHMAVLRLFLSGGGATPELQEAPPTVPPCRPLKGNSPRRLPDDAPCPKCGRPRERNAQGKLICRKCQSSHVLANYYRRKAAAAEGAK